MKTITIIHNPRCSKSREALALIESHGYKVEIIDYLNGGLEKELLENIVKILGVHPKDLLRTKEEEYKNLKIDFDNAMEVIAAILKFPKLLERPIVVRGKQAVVGRPLENVLTLIK